MINKLRWGISLAICFSVPLIGFALDPLPEKPPIPDDNPMSEAKVDLGRKLYFDPRLSSTGTISCNSCHNVMTNGTDNRKTSAGVKGQRGPRNSPTVFNAAFHSVQFWDGRKKSLEAQAKGPMINPVEMGNDNHKVVVKRIKDIPGYVEEFEKVYGEDKDLTIDRVAKAIAAYERTLITPNTPFDQYLEGDQSAISSQAKKGWKTFQKVGCTTCHSGPNFSGPDMPMGQGFYQKFPRFDDASYVEKYDLKEDKGRYEATEEESDKHMWRVPTLRNVALTAPYFHNGSVKTLKEAVRVMGKVQLDKELSKKQVKRIVSFLKTLTGDIPEQEMPELPSTVGRTPVGNIK